MKSFTKKVLQKIICDFDIADRVIDGFIYKLIEEVT